MIRSNSPPTHIEMHTGTSVHYKTFIATFMWPKQQAVIAQVSIIIRMTRMVQAEPVCSVNTPTRSTTGGSEAVTRMQLLLVMLGGNIDEFPTDKQWLGVVCNHCTQQLRTCNHRPQPLPATTTPLSLTCYHLPKVHKWKI